MLLSKKLKIGFFESLMNPYRITISWIIECVGSHILHTIRRLSFPDKKCAPSLQNITPYVSLRTQPLVSNGELALPRFV